MKRSCHGGAEGSGRAATSRRTVALLGMPNCGKSTLFNALTRGHAQIANWPGLTVELQRGALAGGPAHGALDLVDLPGIHDLTGSSEDEDLVQRFLRQTPPDLLLVVLNASQIASQLRLLLQIQTLELPLVVTLNMSDEARRFGLTIDHGGLAAALGVPVVPVSAKHGEGLQALIQELLAQADGLDRPESEPEPGPGQRQVAGLDGRQQDLVERFVRLPQGRVNRRSRAVDRVLLHPLVGLAVFLALVLLVFQLLYALTTPLQELLGALLDGVQSAVLEPGLNWLGTPAALKSFLIDGLWLGVGTVATFMPLIFLFYVLFGIVEDSGYLPRAAFLMDGFMRWLGLDGRSFVLQVMGFGCNVPSIMGTRVIRDRGMRLLAMLCIPFALCQARLTVFVFLVGVFFPRPWWAPGLVLFGFYLLSFAAAIITGLIFKRVYPSREAFVLELPPYRSPSLRTVGRRGWSAMLNFFVTTRVFIICGAAAIWVLTHLPPGAAEGGRQTLAGVIGTALHPLLGPIGLNPDLSVSLFFGFIAKEILLGALAVIYRTSESHLAGSVQAAISPLQALSYMTFVLLYTPCLGTIAAQLKESRSRRFALTSLGWSLGLAWTMAFVVYQGGRLVQGLA